MTIGLKDLYYAIITEESGVETYATPKKLSEAMTADLSVTTADATLYADDALSESASEFASCTLSLGVKELSNDVLKDLLGQEVDDDGVLYAGETDEPPYVAVGFRAKKLNGKYRYIWLLRGKFKVPNESFATKGESIEFKTPTIEGTFSKSKATGKWKADYTGLPTDKVAAGWFNQVKTYTKTVSATE
nr:MAG TPA: tail tube protein [Caudoviricetes sp.]